MAKPITIKREMAFVRPATSDEWLALARQLLFPHRERCGDGTWRWQDFEFYCSACDTPFKSPTTPKVCPNCQAKADDEPQAVELTHKGHTAKTVPFFVPG